MTRAETPVHELDRLHAGLIIAADLRDRLTTMTLPAVQDRLGQVIAFLGNEVVPQFHAEERVLYPAVAARFHRELIGRLSADHVEVEMLLDELVTSNDTLHSERVIPPQLGAQLSALLRLMNAHLHQEEEVVIPMLEVTLGRKQRRAVYERMEESLFDSAVARVARAQRIAVS